MLKKEDFNELRNELKGTFKDSYTDLLFNNCFFNTIDTTCKFLNDDSVFVITGDIPAMWLRDSACQVMQYLFYTKYECVRKLIKGVLKKQFEQILIDPYANAFMIDRNQVSEWDSIVDTDKLDKIIWERKYELDSLCYPLFLLTKYFEITKDDEVFTEDFLKAFDLIIDTVKKEQHHSKDSSYYFHYIDRVNPYVGRNTNPNSEKGLVFSAFRPSDDECLFNYHIPDNMFLVSVLSKMEKIFTEHLNDSARAMTCHNLIEELVPLIEKYGIQDIKTHGLMYVSETNCLGDAHANDDANVPSLLSIPYLEYPYINEEVYNNTRSYILSWKNRYYYKGKVLQGIGSPHTPKNRVWPLAVAMQGITSNNEEEIINCLNQIVASSNNEGLIHEGVDMDDVSKYSRPWFAWANSLFAYFVLLKKDILIKQNKYKIDKVNL